MPNIFFHQSSESNSVLRCREKNARFAFTRRSNLWNFQNNRKVLRHSLSFIGKCHSLAFYSLPFLACCVATHVRTQNQIECYAYDFSICIIDFASSPFFSSRCAEFLMNSAFFILIRTLLARLSNERNKNDYFSLIWMYSGMSHESERFTENICSAAS